MPKKPEIKCPLRKLRLIAGKSQAAFARVLGCSLSTIKKIEEGNNSKLSLQVITAASLAFGVSPDSLVPPSTQPTRLHGEPYTKEFFERWWKDAPELIKPIILKQKAGMLRELEMVLAAAMRAPGMAVGGVMNSFYLWVKDAIIDFQLLPHYETERKEREEKAKQTPNELYADLELAKLFREDKSKFIQEAFEADVSPTPLGNAFLEIKRDYMKKDVERDLEKESKPEKLKLLANSLTKVAKKAFQEAKPINSGPKRTR